MTFKRIEYSGHGFRRLQRRGFTRQQVRWLLAVGERSVERERGGRVVRWGKSAKIGKRMAKVVYFEDAARIRVITVQWIGDPPGEPE